MNDDLGSSVVVRIGEIVHRKSGKRVKLIYYWFTEVSDSIGSASLE